MIRTIYSGVKWGIDPVDDGAQINLFDEESGSMVHIPFTGDSLTELVGMLAQHLSPEAKQKIAPAFTGGVVIAGANDVPPAPPQG